MPSFEIKSFQGISDFEDRGIKGAFKFGSGLDTRKDIDTLSAGQALADDLAVGTMTGLALFIVPSIDGNSYHFCRGGRIYKRTAAGVYSLAHTDPDGNILGAVEAYCSNGKNYMFWATATKLHCKEIPGNATWSVDLDASVVVGSATYTYPKTDLTSATWHTMKWIVGRTLICNGPTLAFVGYDGSYTKNALQLYPNCLSKCLIERSKLGIIGNELKDLSEESPIFSWNTTDLSPTDKAPSIPVKGINSMIDTELPLVQVGNNGKLYFNDFLNVLPILSFPGGGQTNPDGVCNHNGLALFGLFGGTTGYSGVYSFGRVKKDAQIALNFDYPLTCSEIGSVKKVGSDILISYTVGTTYGVKKVSTTAKVARAVFQSVDLRPPAPYDRVVEWSEIKLTMKPLPAGTTVEVWRRIDKTGDFVQCNLPDGLNTLAFSTTGGTEAIFSVGDNGKIFELQIVLNTTANLTPEIIKAEIFFI